MKINELLYVQRYAVGLNEPADYVELMQRYEQLATLRKTEIQDHAAWFRGFLPLLLAVALCTFVSVAGGISFWTFVPVLLVVTWLAFSRKSLQVDSTYYQKELAESRAVQISEWLKSKGIEHTVPFSGGGA